MRKNCSLIGAALDIGQPNEGVDLAPSWLRINGIVETINSKFFQVRDLGDLTMSRQLLETLEDQEEDYEYLSRYGQRLSEVLLEQLQEGQFAFTIGGDHSIAVGTLGATLKYNPDVKIIWVDAHADINTPKTSPSGNLHGMPVAMAMGLLSDSKIREAFKWIPRLSPKNIAYIGLRDVDSGEQKFLDDLGVLNFTAEDVKKLGIDFVLNEIQNKLDPNNDSDFHISFDVDGIDPKFFPSTGTPVDQGIDILEGQKIINHFAQTQRLIALDLVEINPALGDAQSVAQTLVSAKCLVDGFPNWLDVVNPTIPENIWPSISNTLS